MRPRCLRVTLFRMYSKYAEIKGFKVDIVEGHGNRARAAIRASSP